MQLAESSDNFTQAQVFQTLRQIEDQPVSYLYLTMIFANPNINLNSRVLAGLTLNSALKRNSSVLHFEADQLQRIKQMVLEEQTTELQKVKCLMASNLICLGHFDY